MRKHSANPPRNVLPPSANESELLRAIELSGYPLQGLAAETLKSEFALTEEWGYLDRDTNEHRSLDLFGYRNLAQGAGGIVRPGLVILAECKRSVHPFVFFQNVVDRLIPGFPTVAGLKRGVVDVREISGKRSSDLYGAAALGLDKLPFVGNGPAECSAFSRATLSGNKAELSGTELFNSLVLPLVKAFDHARGLHRTGQDASELRPTLLIAVGIVDAPMILVESPRQASDPILTPWVRLRRQESIEDPQSWQRYRFYGIDVIHIDFLDDYLSKHLMPFAEEFGRRAATMAEILVNGGEVENLDNWAWDQIRKRTRQ